MAARAAKLLVLGAPASGKGTICGRIVKRYGLPHVSSGDRLREQVRRETELGLEARPYMERGALVPDELMARLVLDELGRLRPPWVLDGYPRTLPQAEQLWRLQPVAAALNLVVPAEEIVSRVKGRWVHPGSGRVYNEEFNAPKRPGFDDETGEPLVQRPDDRPEAVRHRLQLYRQLTEPMLTFYNAKGILHEFHGKTSDEIWPKVVKFLDTVL